MVKHERAARNRPGGYWIAAEDPHAAHEAFSGTCPVGEEPGHLRRVALLTDGLTRGILELGVYASWAELMKALLRQGPAACVEAIRDAEGADPEGPRWPRSKRSDDATAVVWEL